MNEYYEKLVGTEIGNIFNFPSFGLQFPSIEYLKKTEENLLKYKSIKKLKNTSLYSKRPGTEPSDPQRECPLA